jgi:hypothetical protein
VRRRAKAAGTGKCPVCKMRCAMRVDGTLRVHWTVGSGFSERCDGTYLVPVAGSEVKS